MHFYSILFVCIAVLAPAVGWAYTAGQKKPNIVFILMDNLGYGELGVYGGGILPGAPTPRIDKLASEGMRLLNFNVEAQCTPGRSAIMTGRYAIRSGTHSVPCPGLPDGLTRWEVTIAQLLSGQGYATGHFGKWHLGSDQNRLLTAGDSMNGSVPREPPTKPSGRRLSGSKEPASGRSISWRAAKARIAATSKFMT